MGKSKVVYKPNPEFGAVVVGHFTGLIEEAAFVMERETKAHTPVRTGNLRNSWHADTPVEGMNVHGEVGTAVNYGVYVEFGTSKMQGRHMLAGGVAAAAQWLADHGFRVTYTTSQ